MQHLNIFELVLKIVFYVNFAFFRPFKCYLNEYG